MKLEKKQQKTRSKKATLNHKRRQKLSKEEKLRMSNVDNFGNHFKKKWFKTNLA